MLFSGFLLFSDLFSYHKLKARLQIYSETNHIKIAYHEERFF